MLPERNLERRHRALHCPQVLAVFVVSDAIATVVQTSQLNFPLPLGSVKGVIQIRALADDVGFGPVDQMRTMNVPDLLKCRQIFSLSKRLR